MGEEENEHTESDLEETEQGQRQREENIMQSSLPEASRWGVEKKTQTEEDNGER